MSDEASDTQMIIEVIRGAAGQQVCAGHGRRWQPEILCHLRRNSRLPGLHVEQRKVPSASTPVQLYTRVNGNLRPIQQSNFAAEERNELLSQSQAECVLICAFQEERPLFRKEQRKAGEINLPRVYFCLCEIGIGCKHGHKLRSDLPGDVAAFRSLPC